MKQPVNRGYYAEIINNKENNCPVFAYGQKAIVAAINQGIIEPEHVDVDRKHRGSALNYDVYDVDMKTRTVLIQRRYTVCTKYGNSPTKDYYILKINRGKVSLIPCPEWKARVVKTARVSMFSGELLKRLNGVLI